MLQRSLFVDFVDHFKREYGIEVVLSEAVQHFIEAYADQKDLQVSDVLRKLSHAASALNYMGIQSPFHISREMVEDDAYFD